MLTLTVALEIAPFSYYVNSNSVAFQLVNNSESKYYVVEP